MTLILNPELSRKVWSLAYPIILANLSLTLFNVVDTAMLGRLLPAALAAAAKQTDPGVFSPVAEPTDPQNHQLSPRGDGFPLLGSGFCLLAR